MHEESARTYQSRPHLASEAILTLQAYAELFSHVKHRLLADIAKGKDPNKLKSSYLIKYGITARQFNACRVEIEGKISSIKELQKQHINELSERITSLDKRLAKFKGKQEILHQKKRRLSRLQQRLKKLIEDAEKGRVSLCFGSKKLFRTQFDLKNNSYESHEEWQTDWRKIRSSEIFFLGSKDEASGNQSCTAIAQEDSSLTIRIRLPNALAAKFGKYLVIPNIHYSYGQKEILASLNDCRQRDLLAKAKDPGYKKYGQALTYRFKCDQKGWRLFVTTALPKPQWKTSKNLGVIGVDINLDHLALVETDRFGNPLLKKSIPLNLYGKTKEQSLALIGDACSQVIDLAEQTAKPLIFEHLDFQKKKQALRETASPAEARNLSSFSYQSILTHLKSRAWKKQIEVHQVNPAFTSLIGRVKFAHRYGLSIHHAAALCIGRRFLHFSEKIPRHLDNIPDGKEGHVTFSLPVRNRDQHVWTSWRHLSKKLSVALAAHFRAKRSWSTVKTAPVTRAFPDLIGAIPIRESSVQLLD